MNSLEILNKARNDPVLNRIFLGVFALDKIPTINQYPTALVVNLDRSNLPGSHWIALYFTAKGKCEYFDSYGRKPCLNMQKYIAKPYTYNKICVQDLWSISCGRMCLYTFWFGEAKAYRLKKLSVPCIR